MSMVDPLCKIGSQNEVYHVNSRFRLRTKGGFYLTTVNLNPLTSVCEHRQKNYTKSYIHEPSENNLERSAW